MMARAGLSHAATFPIAIALAVAAPLAARSAQAPPPVPPPVEQHTADCARPVYATDMLVCEDPDLRALDSALASALAQAAEPVSRWRETQQQWFARRSRCAFSADHRACAEVAYRERLGVLQPPDPAAARRVVRCDDPAVAAVVEGGGRTFLLGRAGEVLGVASAGSASSGWEPFLTAMRGKNRLSLRNLAGDTLGCRIDKAAKPGA